MPTPLLLLLLATLLPLVGAPTLLIFGKRLGRLGPAVSSMLSCASFGCAMACLMSFLDGGMWKGQRWGAGEVPLQQYLTIVPAILAGVPLQVGIYLDSLTALMACVVSLVGFLVNVYSITYMRGHPQEHRYFAILGMFLSAMLGLVASGSLVLLYACWELVGICSYLLIGFYHDRPAAPKAATKAFLMNRFADAGFLAALGTLAVYTGSLSLPEIWSKVPELPPMAIYLSAGGLLLAAAAKSALFPFHLWLIDAMEGPTPVSALMHAATMVAAGVYLIARILPLVPPEMLFVLGCLAAATSVFAGICATAQDDLKRLLAFSTVSQLALMIVALASGLYTAALLHLFTHAFFKALLFLSAGAVIHSTGRQKLSELGGLFRLMPFTGSAFAIAALAIAGAPLLAGYYSKDLILTQLAHLALPAHAADAYDHSRLLFLTSVAVSYLTAFYIGRAFFRVFVARPITTPSSSTDPLHSHGPGSTHHASRAHESTNLWVVQMALVGMVIVVGFPWMSPPPQVAHIFESSRFEIARSLSASAPAAAKGWLALPHVPQSFHPEGAVRSDPESDNDESASPPNLVLPESDAAHPDLQPARQLAKSYAGYAYAVGLGLAALLFGVPPIADRLPRAQTLRWLSSPWKNGLGVNLLLVPITRSATALAALVDVVDRYVVDGLVRATGFSTRILAALLAHLDVSIIDRFVEDIASGARAAGQAVLAGQNGRLRSYIAIALVTSSALLATVIFVTM